MNVEGIKTLVTLGAERDRIKREIGLAQSLEKTKREDISILKSENAKSEQHIKSFGFFARIFKRKEYSAVKSYEQSQMARRSADIADLEQSQQDLGALNAQLATTEQGMVSVQQQFKIPEILAKNLQMFGLSPDGHLIIDVSKMNRSDRNAITTELDIEATKGYCVNADKADQLVMVHKTEFFPKDNKILTNHDGKKSEGGFVTSSPLRLAIRSESCRHTSHYTLNRVVENVEGNSWSGTNICVLEEFSKHKNEFTGICTADSYTRDSVSLSDKSLIVVTPKVYESLSAEQKSQGNIVISNSLTPQSFDDTIRLLISANGKPLLSGDSGAAGHRQSVDMKYEQTWAHGNVAFKLLNSNHSIFEDELTIEGDELYKFAYLLYKSGSVKDVYKVIDKNGQEVEISASLAEKFYYGGLRRNEDGSFTRVSDYKSFIEQIEKEASMSGGKHIVNFIKDNNLIEMQQRVNSIQQEFDSKPTPTIEEVLQMPVSQIATFENLKALQVAASHLNQMVGLTKSFDISPEGLVVSAVYDALNNIEAGTLVPTDDVVAIGDQQCVVPLFEKSQNGAESIERTLAESIEIANQVKVYLPNQQLEMAATATSMPQE